MPLRLSSTAPQGRLHRAGLHDGGRLSSWHAHAQRCLSTGRSAADNLSDELHEANLLLTDLVEDDDRSSDDFKHDLDELRAAYARVVEAYDDALTSASDGSQAVSVKKSFELAVVGLRDKLSALEAEAL